MEKRTGRIDVPKQLRVADGLGRAVRRIAERERRPVGQQMVELLTMGVEQYLREGGKEDRGLFSQVLSDSVRL